MQKGDFIICNCCGKRFLKMSEKSGQEFVHIEKEWGYFSEKDGRKQALDVCESCFDRWTSSFSVPIEEQEVTEFL